MNLDHFAVAAADGVSGDAYAALAMARLIELVFGLLLLAVPLLVFIVLFRRRQRRDLEARLAASEQLPPPAALPTARVVRRDRP